MQELGIHDHDLLSLVIQFRERRDAPHHPFGGAHSMTTLTRARRMVRQPESSRTSIAFSPSPIATKNASSDVDPSTRTTTGARPMKCSDRWAARTSTTGVFFFGSTGAEKRRTART